MGLQTLLFENGSDVDAPDPVATPHLAIEIIGLEPEVANTVQGVALVSHCGALVHAILAGL